MDADPESRSLTASQAVKVFEQVNRRLLQIIGSVISIPCATGILTELQIELHRVNTVTFGLENFWQSTDTTPSIRPALIPVQDVIVVLTQLGTVYLELHGILRELELDFKAKDQFAKSWKSNAVFIKKLQMRLQGDNLILCLVSQLISCESRPGAQHIRDAIRNKTTRELEGHPSLANRVRGKELPHEIEVLDSSQPDAARQPSTAWNELTDPGTEINEALNELTLSDEVQHGIQASEIGTSITNSKITKSAGWNALTTMSSDRITSVGNIKLPFHPSELESLNSIASQAPQSSNEAQDSALKYLNQQLDKIMHDPWKALDMKAFMDLYTKIHNFCFGPTKIPFGSVRGGALSGEALYIFLKLYLSSYLKQVYAIADTYSSDDLLSYYNREWNRFKEAAKVINHVFRSFYRHWIKREQDEGRKDLHDVYTLHLLNWKIEVFDGLKGRLVNISLQLIQKLRDQEAVDMSQIKTFVNSLTTLSVNTTSSKTAEPNLDLYTQIFEEPFLNATTQYYQQKSTLLVVANDATDHAAVVDKVLEFEKNCIGPLLADRTIEKLMGICNGILITDDQNRL